MREFFIDDALNKNSNIVSLIKLNKTSQHPFLPLPSSSSRPNFRSTSDETLSVFLLSELTQQNFRLNNYGVFLAHSLCWFDYNY